MVNEPPQPLPQTVCATLEHSGVPMSTVEPITDIPPLFDWMAQIHLYKESFRISATDEPNKHLYGTHVHTHQQTTNGRISSKLNIPWNYVPFLGSRWWSGSISYKFIAIKPKLVVGKILVRYTPDPNFVLSNDELKRNTSIEWDLALSSELVFDIPAYNVVEARPTWIPQTEPNVQEPGRVIWAPQSIPQVMYNFGQLDCEVATKLVPGSLYPDSVRILVFMVFNNTQFYLPTDFRGQSRHALAYGLDSINWPQIPPPPGP